MAVVQVIQETDEYAPTGIEVIIVGCGFAGLACAIESRRKGHKVIVVEKSQEFTIPGDVISLLPNAGRLVARWKLDEQLMKVCTHHDFMAIHNHLGHLLVKQPLPQVINEAKAYNGRRGDIHRVLLEHAMKLGVDIRLGQEVEEYWETDVKAGVTVNGIRLEGDVVVAADGIRSIAREKALRCQDKPKSSGYAIYRAWLKTSNITGDHQRRTAFLRERDAPLYAWIGEDAHFLSMSFNGGEDMCWLLTHGDEYDINESWSTTGDVQKALSYMKDWDPRCRGIVEGTATCIDFKLVHRDPLPTWVSEEGRIILIGDAAHPFLPTAVQGASQGIEDGITLATTLGLAGKKDVPLATRVCEHLRYHRVRYAQIMGANNREKWHKGGIREADEDVNLPFPEWLLNFDAEKHARDQFEAVAEDVKNGYQKPRWPPEKSSWVH